MTVPTSTCSFSSRTALPMWGQPFRLDSGMRKLITRNPKITSSIGFARQERRGLGMGKGYDSLCMTVDCGNMSPFIRQHSRNSQQEEQALVRTVGISWSLRIRTSLPARHTCRKMQTLIAEHQGRRGRGRGGETKISCSFCTSTVCWD